MIATIPLGSCLTIAAIICSSFAHYVFNNIIYNNYMYPEWQYIRRPWNYNNYFPLFDLNSTQMRCFTDSSRPRAAELQVNAGDTIGFNVGGRIIHEGPLLFYMAQATNGATATGITGAGQTWFKIYETHPEITEESMTWPLYNASEVYVQIPPCLPTGYYLLRVEHIALHIAFDYGNAEFFGSCAQLRVIGNGRGSPSPKVAFPGAYTSDEPGILLNIHENWPDEYIVPGPPVWTC